jgi:predicted MFS family arabinose efflux permease
VFAAAIISGFGYYMLHNALLFQVTQRVPQARSLALTLSVAIFFVGQSMGVSIGGWLVDQGRLPQVFLWAAVGIPVIGWLTGRRVSAF